MEFYLRWLDKYEQCEGEESPVGLILWAGQPRTRTLEPLGLVSGIYMSTRFADFVCQC